MDSFFVVAIEQQQHGDKEVFHEVKFQEHRSAMWDSLSLLIILYFMYRLLQDSLSQKPSRPTSLAISEVSLNDPLRSRMSSSSLDSPSLTSPHGGDKVRR
jgi:hypothetical protein